jgi:hypothetical protein
MESWNELEQMKKKLEQRKKSAEEILAAAPPGKLRVDRGGGYVSYYWMKDELREACPAGIYLKKTENTLITALAQKDYARAVVRKSAEQIAIISRFLKKFEPDAIEQIYADLIEERKTLVNPIALPADDYAKRWQSIPYESKSFSGLEAEIYTEKGERVRSKSEKIIADKLMLMGIPYKYECPLDLKGMGKVYPDFTVLNVRTRKEYYWEHLGMMDQAEYCKKALSRIEVYEKNGLMPGKELLLTHETKDHPIQTGIVVNMIKHFLL